MENKAGKHKNYIKKQIVVVKYVTWKLSLLFIDDRRCAALKFVGEMSNHDTGTSNYSANISLIS